MPRVKIFAEAFGEVEIWLDQQKMTDVTKIGINIPLDAPMTVAVEMLVTSNFQFLAEHAEILVGLNVMPGCALRTEKLADGSLRFWSEPAPSGGKTH